MLSSALIISLLLPLQISYKNPRFELFIVQATIDAAVIAGLPASKAAKKYVLQAQTQPEFNLAAKTRPEFGLAAESLRLGLSLVW